MWPGVLFLVFIAWLADLSDFHVNARHVGKIHFRDANALDLRVPIGSPFPVEVGHGVSGPHGLISRLSVFRGPSGRDVSG